jgi:hypothetical protein
MRFGLADPPYVGNSRLYKGHPDYQGEVNHMSLIRRLGEFDGWALCLSIKSLRSILSICPEDVITLAWFKPIAPPLGDHRRYNWEPVILRPVRRPAPGYVPLAHISSPPQFTWREKPKEHVIGEKPLSFCHWIFAAAGLRPEEDELIDLFPGSGAVTKAWKTFQLTDVVRDGYGPEHRTKGQWA